MIDVMIERAPTHVLARLSGELTLATREDAKSRLQNLLEENIRGVAVDLSAVKYIDSSGLGCLVDLNARANVGSSRIVLVAPSPFVAGVLENTRLDRWFEIVHNAQEAAERFRPTDSA